MGTLTADDDTPEPSAPPDPSPLEYRLLARARAVAIVKPRQDAAAFYQKLLRVQLRTTAVPETGKFAAGPLSGKPFATEVDIVQHIRTTLLEEGLVLTASADLVQDPVVDMAAPGKEPRRVFRSEVRVTFTLADAETGFSVEYHWPGVANDGADFGPKQAVTSARGRFLLYLVNQYTTSDEPLPPLAFDDSPQDSAKGSGPEDLPAESSASSAPKSSPDPGPTVEDMKDRAKALRDRFQVWEIEAVIRVLEVPDDREIWATGHYQLLLDEFGTGEAIRVTRAIQDMAKAEPASDDQRAQLDRLVGGKKNIRATMRAEIASAKASGWTWALDYWIKKLQAT